MEVTILVHDAILPSMGISRLVIADVGDRRSIPKGRICCHRGLVVQAAQPRGHRGDDFPIAVDGLEDKAGGAALRVAGGFLDYGFDIRHDVSLKGCDLNRNIMKKPIGPRRWPSLRPRFACPLSMLPLWCG